jgi:dephospho-CoA kinase
VDVVEKGQKIDVAGKGVASLIADARVAQLKAHKTDSGKSEAPKVDKKNVVKHKHEKAAAKAPKFSDEQLIAALKAIGHPATSREVSDALHIADPDYGRSMIRARMDELAKVGKVKMVDAPKDTRFKKLYEVA